MAKNLRGLAARVSALEKAIAKMFSGKKAKVKKKREKVATRKPAKTARKKKAAPKKTRRDGAGSRRPTMEQIVPGGEPLFVTPMDQV